MLINGSVLNGGALNSNSGDARDFGVIRQNSIRTTYKVLLTGSVDNVPDLELPVSSIQIRMGVDPDRLYLMVVVHGVDAYVDGIEARPNGSIAIYREYHYMDGTIDSFNMGTAAFDDIAYSEGGRSGLTGNISGHTSLSLGTPKDVTLEDATGKSNGTSGTVRYTVKLDPRLRPKDNATVNGITFSVTSIVIFITSNQAFMQVGG